MTSSEVKSEAAPWRRRLYLPAYRVKEAARYAGVSSRTVSYWRNESGKEGTTLSDRPLRDGLSYYELVEVAFVATFRKLDVPLKRIRKARDYAAQVLNSECPFVEHKWMTEGPRLLLDFRAAQREASVGRLVAVGERGQADWQEIIWRRFEQFDYADGIALVWHLRGRDNPVLIDPRVSFGDPMVNGIPTWVLKGRWDAGESVPDIKRDFRLSEDDIHHALQFEGVSVDAARGAS